jgi:ribosome biogenesis protein YTM1
VVEAAAEAEPTAAKSKRRKGAKGEGAAAAALLTEEPQGRLAGGHLHCVSSVSYPSSATVYSGGWDHSVRRWDVQAGVNTETYNGSKAVACVAAPGGAPALVAFGGSDRALRLWDTRWVMLHRAHACCTACWW